MNQPVHVCLRLWAIIILFLCNRVHCHASPNFQSPAFIGRKPKVDLQSSQPTINNDATNSTTPKWRQDLPEALRNRTKTLKRLIIPGPNHQHVEVYLLGTAHVSTDSSQVVRQLLDAIEPTVLFVELCDQRFDLFLPQSQSPTPPPNRGFWQRLRRGRQPSTQEGRSMFGAASSLLSNMQQNYAEDLGVELGGEFRVAYEYWEKHQSSRRIHLVLGDRPLHLTLRRAWESLRLWGKAKLLFSLLMSSVHKQDTEELREWMQQILRDESGNLLMESIAELARHFPTLERVIVKERDQYMACKLYQTCRQLMLRPGNRHRSWKLVAVVGAGHIDGICSWLTESNGKQPEELLAPLIKTRNEISEAERTFLINHVPEVDHELFDNRMNGSNYKPIVSGISVRTPSVPSSSSVAYGGRDLAVDFRPPSSGEGNYEDVKPEHYGWVYRTMIEDIWSTLDNLTEVVSGYNVDYGYELAGFVWFQGWNDMLNKRKVGEYEFNLANLIRDVRADLDAPNLPFLIGELGMKGMNATGWGSRRYYSMQRAERDVALHDEFRNNTLFVPTAKFMSFPGNDTYNGVYHYDGRADVYSQIGRAFGRAMLQLLGATPQDIATPGQCDNVVGLGNQCASMDDSPSFAVFEHVAEVEICTERILCVDCFRSFATKLPLIVQVFVNNQRDHFKAASSTALAGR